MQSGWREVRQLEVISQQLNEAWKRRWFVLRSGRLTGDPDVLEYYKNDHAKKPIRIIDLNLCQQVDAGLTFNKKEFENSYIFDINTIDRVFYLVADSEEEMNKWVRCICDICGFNPTDEVKFSLLRKELVDLGRVRVKGTQICKEMVSVSRENKQLQHSKAMTELCKVGNGDYE
ncbi:hypothetical protein llap_17537 [Limosa lapponica baueri]|uniref:PH domain-containing protein n=1 Tax=Limosa lapponica baueri TaxID=1758121 RepID=A0A2I0TEE0_LIMLA|nr:hypothetical protein llap_17537 [Limosa lapponica baueri]